MKLILLFLLIVIQNSKLSRKIVPIKKEYEYTCDKKLDPVTNKPIE